MPKMLTSLRTAAMGVLLLHLRIEMGASVWTTFPQLQTLSENALASFVAAQLLPQGSSKADLKALAEQCRRLLPVYRQCRRAFHAFAASIAAINPDPHAYPNILMTCSTERWPTFCEMFPGIREDDINAFGPAATLQLPGKHNETIHRCLSNQEATFTGAVETFLGTGFGEVWWWAEHVSSLSAQPSSQPVVQAADLLPLLATLRESASTHEAPRSRAILPSSSMITVYTSRCWPGTDGIAGPQPGSGGSGRMSTSGSVAPQPAE